MGSDSNSGGQAARGFSLVEVILATGIFAASIVAILGLMNPLLRSTGHVADSETAARLVGTIQSELERIGFAQVATLPAPIQLFATRDGGYVVLGSKADNDPTNGDPRGIPVGERYFLITLNVFSPPAVPETDAELRDVNGSAFHARLAKVEWPYFLPDGGGGGTEAAPAQRNQLVFPFAINL